MRLLGAQTRGFCGKAPDGVPHEEPSAQALGRLGSLRGWDDGRKETSWAERDGEDAMMIHCLVPSLGSAFALSESRGALSLSPPPAHPEA